LFSLFLVVVVVEKERTRRRRRRRRPSEENAVGLTFKRFFLFLFLPKP